MKNRKLLLSLLPRAFLLVICCTGQAHTKKFVQELEMPQVVVGSLALPPRVAGEVEEEIPGSVATTLQLPNSGNSAPVPSGRVKNKSPLPSFVVSADEFEDDSVPGSSVKKKLSVRPRFKKPVPSAAITFEHEEGMPEIVVDDLSLDYEGNVVGGQASIGDQSFEFSVVDNQVAIPETVFYDFFDQRDKQAGLEQVPSTIISGQAAVAQPRLSPMISVNRDQLREEIRSVLQEFLQQVLVSLGGTSHDDARSVFKPVAQFAEDKHVYDNENFGSKKFTPRPTPRAASTETPTSATVDIGPTAFGGKDRFFLGFMNDSTGASNTLVRASLGTSTVPETLGQKIVQTTPLVPTTQGSFSFNGVSYDVSADPLKDTGTAHLALAGSDKKLVVVPLGGPAPFDPMAGLDALTVAKNQKGASVYLLPTDDGARLITNSASDGSDKDFIKDAAGVSINQQIVAMTASQPEDLDQALIFAAVPDGSLVEDNLNDQPTDMIILAPKGSLKNWASDTVTDTSVAMPVPQLVYDGITNVSVIDGVNRGIAVLKRSRGNVGNALDALTVVSDDGISANNKAHKLRVDAESDGLRRINPAETIAFYAPGDPEPITRAIIGPDVDMVWDEPLQRLFIGLSDVTRGHNVGAVTNKSGGVCSVLVGKVDANQKITLYPVLKNPSSYLFADVRKPDAASPSDKDAGNYNKYILGFYENNTNNNNTTTPVDLFASARAVRTMHTSTGKSYLIMNGGVGSRANNPRNVNTQIYAIPLVDEGNDTGFVGFFDDSSGTVSALDCAPFFEAVRTNIEDAINQVDGLVDMNRKDATTALKNQNPPLTANALASTILEEVYKYSDRKTAALAVEARVKIAGTQNPVTVAAAQAILESPSSIAKAILQNRIPEVSVENTLYNAAQKAVNGMTANKKKVGAAAAIQAGAGWALHQAYEGTFRDDFLKLVSNMPVSSQVQTIVGADPQLLSFDTTLTITDMHVHGDTIYVSAAGDRDAEHLGEAGIFASKALFNEKGAIRAWTPWQRVMGRPEKVYGFDFDDETSNFWFVTEDSSQKINTVRVTEWGKGDNALHSDTQTMNAPLSSVLDAVFADAGGLFGLFDFSPDSYGFKERNPQALAANQSQRYEQFGMMVATGQGRVALIESGIFANNVFTPTGPFVSSPTNEVSVRIFSANDADGAGLALGQLGAITCAEIARMPLDDAAPNSGRLFVGGEFGVAVFTQGFTGKGWDTRINQGLSKFSSSAASGGFPRGKGWRFLRLMSLSEKDGTTKNIFTNVRRIISDQHNFLYILTRDTLYRLDMNQLEKDSGNSIFEQDEATRTQANIKDKYLVKVASVADSTDGTANIFDPELDEFFDVMVLQRDVQGSSLSPVDLTKNATTLLLATTRGLYGNLPATLTDDYQKKYAIKQADVTHILWQQKKDLGPTLMFEFYSSSRGNRLVQDFNQPDPSKKVAVFTAEGNLYTFALDSNQEFLARYRFNVSAGDITPIAEPYVDASNTPTDYFFKVGSFDEPVNDAEFTGALDSYARTKSFGGDNFVNAVPVRPASRDFIKDPFTNRFEEINFDLSLSLPLQQARLVQDTASGAVYVPGEFGVRVNE